MTIGSSGAGGTGGTILGAGGGGTGLGAGAGAGIAAGLGIGGETEMGTDVDLTGGRRGKAGGLGPEGMAGGGVSSSICLL